MRRPNESRERERATHSFINAMASWAPEELPLSPYPTVTAPDVWISACIAYCEPRYRPRRRPRLPIHWRLWVWNIHRAKIG